MSPRTSKLQLLSLLRAVANDQTDLELASFDGHQIKWAITTGLGPLLYRSTHDDPNRTSDPHWPAVQSSDLTARVLSGETLDAATEILEACGQVGSRVVLLKGISTCTEVYPEPHLRPMGDIDLLVSREDVEPLESSLTQLGYAQRSRYPLTFYASHHHTCPFFRADTRDWVEVHVALFPPQSQPGRDPVFAAANVAQELTPSTFRGHRAQRLSVELQVVYLATHWGFELETVGALVPMVDLVLLIGQNPGLDWNKIQGWLSGSETAAAHLYLLLSFLDQHRVLNLEPNVLAGLRSTQRPFGRTNRNLAFRLLERYAVRGEAFGPLMTEHNFNVVWRTLLLPDAAWLNLARLPWRLIPERFRALS